MNERPDVLVIGAGPAGLSSAIYASRYGLNVLVVDENHRAGGQLIKQTHMFFGAKQHYCGTRGIDIAKILEEQAVDAGVEISLETTAVGFYDDFIVAVVKDETLYKIIPKALIVCTGATENMLAFPGNDLPGVYGAGAVQTLMNVYGVKPADKILMVGSGNIGLIVSYQLMQAGIEVVAIVEAMDRIGGYLVHAAKVRRLGIPIYTSHTLKEVRGQESVEEAVIVAVDEAWEEVPGTEKLFKVDGVCLAVGLSPVSEILWLTGAEMKYVPELGGFVALHNEDMETTKEGVYVAGDASGVEEAVAAILEGAIAGLSSVIRLKLECAEEARSLRDSIKADLAEFRAGPFGKKIVTGKYKVFSLLEGKNA